MRIENDGPLIVSTDYWRSEHGAAGALYLSVNAGAFRLLVPPRVEAHVPLERVVGAAVSRGPHRDLGLDDALEVLLDDESDSPWCAHLSHDSIDRLPLDDDTAGPRSAMRRVGRDLIASTTRAWLLTVWHRDGADGARCVLSVPCTYRRARRLPDLRPWGQR